MARRGALIGILALLLARPAEATELDRMRELDEAQRQQRAFYERAFSELRQSEAERIGAEDGRVKRNGAELELWLSQGRKTFFRNDDSRCLQGLIPSREDGCVEFIFIGHPIERFYLLRAHYLAGSDYRLVDRVTGLSTKLIAEPHFSPDSRRFITVSAAEIYDPVGIEMWSIGEGEPSLDWQHRPTAYALYDFIRWEGNASVMLDVATYIGGEIRHVPARLTLGDEGWRLDGPAESWRY